MTQEHARTNRKRRLFAAFTTGIAGRGVSVVAPLLMIPLMLQALGTEVFGIWATITSFTAMLVFADFGLGSGLLTALSSAFGREDLGQSKQVVSNAYFAVTCVSAVGAAITLSIVILGDVPGWLGVSLANRAAAHHIVIVLVCAFFLMMPLSLITVVQIGVQQGWQSNVWAAAGPIVSVLLVWLGTSKGASASSIVAFSTAGPIIVALANNLAFFLGTAGGRSIAPRLLVVSGTGCRALLAMGSAFAGLSVLSNVALNIDNTLIAVSLGGAEVTAFAIAARVFRSVALLVNIVSMPLWGANGEAMARGDYTWVRQAAHRSAIVLVGTSIAIMVPAVIFRRQLVEVWVGTSVSAPLSLYAGLAVWSALVAFTTPYFSVQNAAGFLRVQAIGWGLYLGISVVLKVLLLPVLGIESIAWITALSYAATVVPSAILGYHRVLQERQGSLRPLVVS